MDLAPARHPQPAPDRIVNGLSVDVEDWFQVGAFENTIARGDWDGCELRVERNVERVLALFDRAGVKATFFTLGWVAERVPHAIRAIADAGHADAAHVPDLAEVAAPAVVAVLNQPRGERGDRLQHPQVSVGLLLRRRTRELARVGLLAVGVRIAVGIEASRRQVVRYRNVIRHAVVHVLVEVAVPRHDLWSVTNWAVRVSRAVIAAVLREEPAFEPTLRLHPILALFISHLHECIVVK